MPTVYHRDQPGAPSYVFSASTANAAHFNALKTILKACLVEGYGAQPPAGWELIAEGDQFLVLRNGTQSGYVCITRPATNSSYVEIWLAETFSGVVSNRMTGVGLKSGTAALNSAPQKLNMHAIAHSSALSSWYVIADERAFCFQGAGNDTGFSGSVNNSRSPLYVGEDSEGWFVSVGGSNLSSASSGAFFDSSAFTALRYPGSGLLVDSGAINISTPALSPAGSASNSINYLLKEVDLGRVRWAGDNIEAGYLLGIAVSPQLINVDLGFAASALGFDGVLNARNFNTALDVGDENTWFIGVQQYSSATRFVTDAPEFW